MPASPLEDPPIPDLICKFAVAVEEAPRVIMFIDADWPPSTCIVDLPVVELILAVAGGRPAKPVV